MTLIESAKTNGLDPQAYLREVLEPIPTARQSDLAALLLHNCKPSIRCVITGRLLWATEACRLY